MLGRNRKICRNENAFILTMTLVWLILGLVLIVGVILFLVWLISNLMNFIIPICIIVVIALVTKHFLLKGKKVKVNPAGTMQKASKVVSKIAPKPGGGR